MGIKSTKEQLIQILADADNKVVALTGKWGTGKTHLFGEVRRESTDAKVKEALTVSLFGLRDMDHVKLRLLQSALPNADKNSAEWQGFTKAFSAIKNVLIKMHGGFSAIDELALIAVPQILKNKFIVLDDIERKHPELSIDEVLGFIDEFTQSHGSRFLLVLNSDQLKDQDLWKALTEKVIDQEVRLTIEPEEAFSVASRLSQAKFPDSVRNSVLACGITNIRVVRKVIKAVNRILGGHHDLPLAVLARVVPSATLIAATHYKGIEGGPTVDYILATGNRYGPNDDDDTVINKTKSHAQWDFLLSDLGIIACDEFELIVADFLNSGLIDMARVSRIIDRYVDEQDSLKARKLAQEFVQSVLWDHRSTNDQLLEKGRGLINVAPRIDAVFISTLAEQLGKLIGGSQVADDLVDTWIAAMPPNLEPDSDDDFVFQQRLHPRIKQALDANAARAQAVVTVLDVCIRVFEKSSWGSREEIAMRGATAKDFEDTIRSIEDLDKFRNFMRKMLDFTRNKLQYEKHFEQAMDNFVEACRRISITPDATRLSSIILNIFTAAELQGLLEPRPKADLPK